MRFYILFVILTSLLLLGSCGGSSPNLNEGEPPQDQQEITPPEQSADVADEAAPVNPQADPAPDIGSAPPAGAAVMGLTRGVMETVELPAMDPAKLVPEDTELPVLWLFKISNGATVYGSIQISTLAVDNTDTNLVALLIDRELAGVSESAVLEHTWDTRELADGSHELIFVVRDNGNNMGLCTLHVEVDNSTDFGPPVIEIEGMSNFYNGDVYQTADNLSTHHRVWPVVGQSTLKINAYDGSGIERIELYSRDHPNQNERSDCAYSPINWANCELISYGDEDGLSIVLDTYAWETGRYFLVKALDRNGESTTLCFMLSPQLTSKYYARIRNSADEHIVGVNLYLMPPGWIDTGGEIDVSVALDHGISTERYLCSIAQVPIGPQTFVAVYGEQTIVMPYSSNILLGGIWSWRQLPAEGVTIFWDE